MRQSAIFFGASMALNVAGFVFHAIASRKLGVDEYGTLYALISALAIVGLPSGVLAPVIMRFAAEFRALHDDAHVRRLSADIARWFSLLGVLYVAVGVAAAGPIAAFLHVPRWTIWMMAAIAGIIVVSNSLRAVAQGVQDFAGCGWSMVAEGATKVLAVLAFLLAGLGVAGGIGAFLAGSALGLLAIAVRLWQSYGGAVRIGVRYDWRRIAISGAGAATATIASTLMSSGDTVLVKHFFTAADAGIYGAAALGGKILLYFVSFVPVVLLPQATDRHVRGERTRGVIAATLLAVLALSAVVLAGMKVDGLLVLHVLVGHQYDAAAGLLVWYSAAMAFYATTLLLTSYGIATHRLWFCVPVLAGAIATLGGIVADHATLLTVVEVLLLGNALTALATGGTLALQAVLGERRAGAPS